ncbi:hypothetical protein BC827DRAFT_674801 [Russula dissimulans]|nr:hypothetical protein BC827DRAFT_674801 [Russula dissimulans]
MAACAPTPTLTLFSTSISTTILTTYTVSVQTLPDASPSKSSSNIGPIAGGAAGGFVFLIVVVATIWYILKKCRKPNTEREEEEVAFPFPVTRDRDQTRRLDLAKESRPYEYGVVGRSVPISHSPPMASHTLTSASDGRRDSATPLIGTSSGALTPMPSSGLMTSNGAQTDVGRQRSQSSTHHQLPPGAAAPVASLDHYSQSGSGGGGGGGGGSVSGSSISAGPSGRRALQVVNPRLSPTPTFGFSPEIVPGSSSVPMAAPGSEKQRFEVAAQDLSSSSGPVIVHSDGGRVQPHDHRPSVSSSGGVPQSNPSALPATPEPTEAPPAYAE